MKTFVLLLAILILYGIAGRMDTHALAPEDGAPRVECPEQQHIGPDADMVATGARRVRKSAGDRRRCQLPACVEV